jgi:hypothetical protein
MRDALALYRTCTHEAAHVATAEALGVRCTRAEVHDSLESGRTLHEHADTERLALICLAPQAFDSRMSASDERDFQALCAKDPSLRDRREHLLSELARMRRETSIDANHNAIRQLLIRHRRIVSHKPGEWEAG